MLADASVQIGLVANTAQELGRRRRVSLGSIKSMPDRGTVKLVRAALFDLPIEL
jgi:hypothetical protein